MTQNNNNSQQADPIVWNSRRRMCTITWTRFICIHPNAAGPTVSKQTKPCKQWDGGAHCGSIRTVRKPVRKKCANCSNIDLQVYLQPSSQSGSIYLLKERKAERDDGFGMKLLCSRLGNMDLPVVNGCAEVCCIYRNNSCCFRAVYVYDKRQEAPACCQ